MEGGEYCGGYNGDGTASGVRADMPGNCGLGALRQGVLSGVPRSLPQNGLALITNTGAPGPHLTESESQGSGAGRGEAP